MLNYNLSPTTGEVREFRDGRFNASREPTDYEKQLFEEIEKLKKENQELSNRLEKLVMPKIAEIMDSEIALAKFSLEISQDDNYEYGIDVAKEKIKLLEKLKQRFSNFSA